MKRLLYVLFVLFFCLSTTALSQISEWINYTNGDEIYTIATETNFLWIGTTGGLVKIDKYSGNTIFFDELNSGLPTNRSNCIAIDISGNKWIGTDEGLVKFDGTDWAVYNTLNSGLPSNVVECIAVDEYETK